MHAIHTIHTLHAYIQYIQYIQSKQYIHTLHTIHTYMTKIHAYIQTYVHTYIRYIHTLHYIHYTDGLRGRMRGDVTKILKATKVRMRQNLVLECGYQGSF